jgi:maltose alpha-D-glucosyltransferase / alpha-amylase
LTIYDTFSWNNDKLNTYVFFAQADYMRHTPENYLLSGKLAFGEDAVSLRNDYPKSLVADIDVQGNKGILYDATFSHDFRNNLLSQVLKQRQGKR